MKSSMLYFPIAVELTLAFSQYIITNYVYRKGLLKLQSLLWWVSTLLLRDHLLTNSVAGTTAKYTT